MSFILSKALNPHIKSFVSDRIFSLVALTVLPSVNHIGRINKNANQTYNHKILKPVHFNQHRYFSINFSDSLYESITTSEATKSVVDFLIKTHDLLGLHWGGTLLGASLMLKLFYSIPCAIYQHKLIAKTELITLQSKPLITNLKHEILIEGRQKRWSMKMIEKKFKKETIALMKKIRIDNNIHPLKIIILSLIQIPPWILMSTSISKLASDSSSGTLDSVAAALQFSVGGPFWCQNLSIPDPTYILPISVFLLTLTNFEINLILKSQKEIPRFYKIYKNLLRIFAVVFFLVALKVSAGLTLFWTCNAFFGLVQNLLLYSPKVRRLLRIPKTPFELEKPYKSFAEEVRDKWRSVLKKK